MKNTRITFIILILLYSFAFLSATIINIPADYSQIQQGIDISAEGDTILVQPGTYYENINYNGHNIVVGSMFLTTQNSSYIEQTIIDGSQNGSVVMFESGETSSAILTGFTIRNGSGYIMPNDVHCGGGIFCHKDSDPVIMNCIVTQNNAGDGGGIFCYLHSDPIIINVEISYNTTYDDGGGLHCNWGSNPTLENVRIFGNYCADKGAGICCGHNEHPTDLTLNNVMICQNTSGEKGSAIYMVNSSSYFNHVTICDNTTESSYWGSIYCEDAYINLNNSIIWNNQYSGFNFYNGGYADVTYSNTQDYFVGEGNISQDPYFVNPTIGNYHLQEISPCIDAGDPASPLDPDGTITDMGAYYFHQGGLLNADFLGEPLSGIVPLDVQFTDLSTGNILEWEWDFNNDGIIDSYLQNPIYIFNNTGLYTVALTVSDGIEEITEIKTNYIAVSESLHADFEGLPISGEFPLDVQFTDLSTGNIAGYMWDFDNDGMIDSNQQNPLFIYEQIGSYDVSLTITDGFDEDTEVKFNYITVFDTTSLNDNTYLLHTKLNQNYPNPFNPTTTIEFYLASGIAENAELVIYNLKGQKIQRYSILNNQSSIVWNGTDESGKLVTSGVYLYRLLLNGKPVAIRKMLLMK